MRKPVDNSLKPVDNSVDKLWISLWITAVRQAWRAWVLPVDNPMRGH